MAGEFNDGLPVGAIAIQIELEKRIAEAIVHELEIAVCERAGFSRSEIGREIRVKLREVEDVAAVTGLEIVDLVESAVHSVGRADRVRDYRIERERINPAAAVERVRIAAIGVSDIQEGIVAAIA